jgi:hypothetical protein
MKESDCRPLNSVPCDEAEVVKRIQELNPYSPVQELVDDITNKKKYCGVVVLKQDEVYVLHHEGNDNAVVQRLLPVTDSKKARILKERLLAEKELNVVYSQDRRAIITNILKRVEGTVEQFEVLSANAKQSLGKARISFNKNSVMASAIIEKNLEVEALINEINVDAPIDLAETKKPIEKVKGRVLTQIPSNQISPYIANKFAPRVREL